MSTVNFENLAPGARPQRGKEEKNRPIRVRKDIELSGKVRVQRPSAFKRFGRTLIEEDLNTVKESIFYDILIPAIKEFISQAVRDGVDMLLYGDSPRGRSSRRDGPTSYNTYFKSRSSRESRREERRPSGISYEELKFDSKTDAQKVIDEMLDDIDDYGEITVSELYSIVKKYLEDPSILKDADYTDVDYGWTDLTGARPKLVRGGYILDLPRAKYIN